MDTYTVSEVAIMLNVSSSTIRNYTGQAEIQPFLSDHAKRTGTMSGAKERRYLIDDVKTLNTVKIHKTQTATWADVIKVLESGYRDELPETASLVMAETRSDMFQLLARARERMLAQEQQIEELEQKLVDSESGRREDIERLMKEREDMRELIGGYKLIFRQHGIDPETGKKKE
jgi:DNA-binding transcriptional MerR regulator